MTDPARMSHRSGRWLKLGLALSLALNIGIAGVIAGSVLRHGSKPVSPQHAMRAPAERDGPDITLRTALGALDRTERRALHRDFRPPQPDAEMRPLPPTALVLQALRAEQFDPEPLSDALDAGHDRLIALNRRSQQALLDALIAMPPDARRAYADRLEAALARRAGDGRSPRAIDTRR